MFTIHKYSMYKCVFHHTLCFFLLLRFFLFLFSLHSFCILSPPNIFVYIECLTLLPHMLVRLWRENHIWITHFLCVDRCKNDEYISFILFHHCGRFRGCGGRSFRFVVVFVCFVFISFVTPSIRHDGSNFWCLTDICCVSCHYHRQCRR